MQMTYAFPLHSHFLVLPLPNNPFFFFIIFHLSLFLKIQYPTTQGYTRELTPLFPLAYASGNTPTRTGVLRPALRTPNTSHHLDTPSPQGSLPRLLRTQPPTTTLSPVPSSLQPALSSSALPSSFPNAPPPPSAPRTLSLTYAEPPPPAPRPPSSGLRVPDAPGP